MARVAVVGGGISGLVAARAAAQAGAEVVLFEGSPRIGGKLQTASVAGIHVDIGAEAMLHRRPEGVALAREVDAPIVHPTPATSRIWSGGRLRPMPRSLMGVPMDLRALERSGILSEEALATVRAEPRLPVEALARDASVAEVVGKRFGPEVVDRLLEPLLGGVYAGHASQISVRAAVPQLVAMLGRGSLLEQAAALPTSDEPVFAGVRGGMGRLPGLIEQAGGFEIRRNAMVRELRRESGGFRLTVGPTIAAETVTADAVVVATPAAPAARLLGDVAAEASRRLAEIETASVVVVTLAFRAADLAGLAHLDGSVSGFLVPPSERRRIKAATFSFAKWAWVREAGGDDVVHLRTSLGRHGEESAIQASDAELVAWSMRDLVAATGLGAVPIDTHVQRWGGALPQYAVGHLERIAAVRADVARVPGLAVAGASLDGVGVPACVGSARRAVTDALSSLCR